MRIFYGLLNGQCSEVELKSPNPFALPLSFRRVLTKEVKAKMFRAAAILASLVGGMSLNSHASLELHILLRACH
jgi:hypothetical protein